MSPPFDPSDGGDFFETVNDLDDSERKLQEIDDGQLTVFWCKIVIAWFVCWCTRFAAGGRSDTEQRRCSLREQMRFSGFFREFRGTPLVVLGRLMA